MNNVALVLAAGSGSRMKSEKNKMLLEIMGKTVIERSVEAFLENPEIDEIIVTAREQELDAYISLFDDERVTFVIGGATRQQSVKNAVETIDEADFIIIHDGARPFIRQEEIDNTLRQAYEHGAAAVGVPVRTRLRSRIQRALLPIHPTGQRFLLFRPRRYSALIYISVRLKRRRKAARIIPTIASSLRRSVKG